MSSTREKILQVAKRMFCDRGYHATTVEDIVNAVGLSKGAFYFYFRGKDELFKTLVEEMHSNMLARLQRWVEEDIPVGRVMLEYGKEVLEDIHKERHIAQIFLFQLVGAGQEFRELYFDKIRDWKTLLISLMEKGVEKGEFTYKNPENIVNLYAGFLRMLILECILREDGCDIDKTKSLAEEGICVLLRGLKDG